MAPLESGNGFAVSLPKGRRKEAAANRAPMACLPCREAKHKCHGQPPAVLTSLKSPSSSTSPTADNYNHGVDAEAPCARCATHSLRCIWLPKAKLGRPRKDTSSSSSSNIAPPVSSAPVKWPKPPTEKNIDINGVPRALLDSTHGLGGAMTSQAVSPELLSLPQVESSAILFTHATAPSLRHPYPPSLAEHCSFLGYNGIPGDQQRSWSDTPPFLPPPPQSSLYSTAPYSSSPRQQPHDCYDHGQSQPYQPSLWTQQVSQIAYAPLVSGLPVPAGSEMLPQAAMPLSSSFRQNQDFHGRSIPMSSDVRSRSALRHGVTSYFRLATRCCLALVAEHESRLDSALACWADIFATVPFDMLPTEGKDLLTLVWLLAVVGYRVERLVKGEREASNFESALHSEVRKSLDAMLQRGAKVPASFQGCRQLSYSLQALLLGCALEYGTGDTVRAMAFLQGARSLTTATELHLFDDCGGVEAPIRPGTSPLRANLFLRYGGVDALKLADDLRRSFWEVCMTEVTMLMCTGTSSKDYLLERHSHFSINFPQLLGPDGQNVLIGYTLRYRAASVFLDVCGPETRPEMSTERLTGLFRVISDVMHQCKRQIPYSTTEHEVEMVTSTYLMLNAARIQLVRRQFFTSYSAQWPLSGYGPQSFNSVGLGADNTLNPLAPAGRSTGSEAATEDSFAHVELRQALKPSCFDAPVHLVANAVQAMVEAADNISGIIKSDFERKHLEGAVNGTGYGGLSQGFSPFHIVAHVTAASAYIAALTYRASDASSWRGTTGVNVETIDLTPSKVEGPLTASQWSLRCTAVAWPIAQSVAEEVRLCRQSLNGSLPSSSPSLWQDSGKGIIDGDFDAAAAV